MNADTDRHSVDLASSAALAAVSMIDFYTARSLSLVAYVEPHQVSVVRTLDTSLSLFCALGVVALLVSWPFLSRATHRWLTLAVLTLQTMGLGLDVVGLLMSALLGKRGHPLYLLLEAALVHVSTVLLFGAWYATLDHHRQVARARGQTVRQGISFAQHAGRYPGYEGWVPGTVDYLSFAFTTSSCLGPAEAIPLAASVKMLIMLQVSFSLVILLVLAARAIGLIT